MRNLFDLGTLAAAVGAFIVAAGIALRDVTGTVFRAIWDSFKALATSQTTVWLAVLLIFLGGFWVGYLQGVSGKRALRAEVAQLETAAAEREAALAEANARAKAASDEAQGWKAKAEGAAVSQPAAVAGVSRRPVARADKTKSGSGEAPKADWRPFSN